ncbi:MAG: LapA family protein [Campylobacter sp.]|nr:LapA family protein [Campylobacter sp.]
MKIKHFIIYSLIYISLIGVITFIINPSSYTFSLLGTNLEFPVAIWVILPLFLLMLMAIAHVGYYGIKAFNAKNALKSDINLYETYAKEILLGVEADKKFKTNTFKIANEVTKYLSPWHDNKPNLEDSDITEVIDMLNLIKQGDVIDLKRYKLKEDNPIFIKNELNKLITDPKYANEILKNKTSLDDELSKTAYQVLLKNGTYLEIKKYDFGKSKDEIKLLIDRYVDDENFEVSKDDLFILLDNEEFTQECYIKAAQKLSKRLEPDAIVAMFNKLKDKKSDASKAYLYLLYEFGMIEDLKEKLMYSDGGDYEKFEILVYLKDQGKNIPANYFF